MPRYYCDYCDTYLTHDSPSVRKQHNQGYKHKANVRIYYQQFEEQQTQILIDQRIKEHLGKASVYPQVGSAYNQHLGSFPGQRPPLPLLPTPNAQMPSNLPLFMGVRPPVLPRPVPGAPGYMSAPFNSPMFVAPSLPGQENGPPRPPMLATMSGNTGPPASSATPSMVPPPMYQSNPAQAAPTSGSYDQQHQT